MNNQMRCGAHGELLIFSQSSLRELDVKYEDVIQIVENAFIALRTGDSENPLKTIVQPSDKRSLAYSMVGRDGSSDTIGFKIVYEFDPHRTQNAYSFHSFIFLCDDRTGQPIALMDVVELGPLRTSATSALMARAARPNAKSALVVGTGVQGQMALPMLLAAMPELERLQVFGSYEKGIRAVQDSVKRRDPRRDVDIATDLKKAAAESDIIIGAAGLSAKGQVRHEWLKPGAAAILLGYGIGADVFHAADYRITTDTAQMRVTCGDLAGPEGKIPPVDAELPEILLGRVPARRDERDIVFSYNSGMVVTDVALGRYLADRALARDKGQRVQLW